MTDKIKETKENRVVTGISDDILIVIDRRNAKVLLSYLEQITMGQLVKEQIETARVLHKLMRSLRYDLRPDA